MIKTRLFHPNCHVCGYAMRSEMHPSFAKRAIDEGSVFLLSYVCDNAACGAVIKSIDFVLWIERATKTSFSPQVECAKPTPSPMPPEYETMNFVPYQTYSFRQ